MRYILMSIKPKWCELIFSGQKTAEIRKTRPKDPWGPYLVYIWETGNGGIVGTFKVRDFRFIQAWEDLYGDKHLGNCLGLRHCLDDEELFNYLYKKRTPGNIYNGGWAWKIEKPEKLKTPLPLSHFGLKRPPQSWQYVEVK